MIEAKIIADSISPNGYRLTTFYAKYPRFVHSELLRHRTISHSVMSSRAISIEKMIQKVKDEPVIPLHWGQNQKGMQAFREIDSINQMVAKTSWLEGRDKAIETAEKLNKLGLAKQIVNRVLEPYVYIEEVISGTDWGNFFNLRVHKDAQPELRELAIQIMKLYISNTPSLLQPGEWHLPSITEIHDGLDLKEKLKVSFAICARSSYATFEGSPSVQKDIDLHDRLTNVFHVSPAEHQGTPMTEKQLKEHNSKYGPYSGNFCGWIQYRKLLPNENRKEFNAEQLLKNLEAE